MNKSPRVLYLDIETSPIVGMTWQAYEANLNYIISPTKIISVGHKWTDEKRTTVRALPDFKGYKANKLDDLALCEHLWVLLDEADVVIAHNGDGFDIKKANARFIANEMTAPSTYKTVDTLKVAKKYFYFDKNNLDELGKLLDEGQKMNTGGFELWLKCMAGDMIAWKLMKQYNSQDVDLLEKVYLRLRPYIENHPNLNMVVEGAGGKDKVPHCPACRSTNLQKRGFTITHTGHKQRYQCTDCGSWSSGSFVRAKGEVLR